MNMFLYVINPTSECLDHHTYHQLQNHKRGHESNLASANIISQYIAEDVEMQNDIRNDIIDNNELVNDSDNNNQYYAVNAIEIDEVISYKCSCSFEDSEGEAHIYDSSRIDSNTFTKAKLMNHNEVMLEPGAKISHGKTVDALLKSKSSVKGHEYDVCLNGCQLYGINDDQESCVDCDELQYKTDTEQSQTPAASMKLMSVGDMFSQMLADSATRELLHYRANWESVAGQLTNIFDGKNYKQLVQQGLFSNPNNIAIGLYTNGFVNQKKGKSSYTIVHAVLAILPGPKKPTHLDSFLGNGVEVCRAKIHLLLASGDIPAVADMTNIGSHASLFGCQICKTKGKASENRWHGIYFEDSSAPLRPLEDFKTGNPIKNVYQPSIFSELSTFFASSFFALDELHLVARGIGKHIYDLITVSLTKETKIFIPVRMIPSPPQNTHFSYQELVL
ncbi:hypothetical protein PHYBLDRAFT_151731 [Phycomyces blakesleeanus NRRL 1555(-)]|uniref:Uncharacterized protein n=1 Tax=Phycomyces blakesleeanus (strain ATCC 8743b / DSM 1359 / FGSC 10004 / NBRC 33097 / NRRL 1555) TaxID=763407 RepID=A0A167K2F0_PHYB8|nr:hypothetical protein PHYBLDRAFT_151731 [Phycomyces blakesleeanus NRRL 1555(-)]OAD67127.1 hypothetical protein PHYBLDRAFT_151731 [Phycomyces blakesleeanus NRRL 1555(-)]|eukprot:XP_018285167.1 hypothetical protein PHYBLDRAFT_151731 [Phycomyces blakesleeanus NRRL 1555(-)]